MSKHEMTVEEFFKLLDIYDYDESKDARDVFGENYHYSFQELLDVYTDEEIISKFHEYKTIKGKKKILTIKWVVTCRIIQTENRLKKCVYEEDMPKNQTNANDFCEEVLKKYASEHEGDYFAVTTNRCIAVRSDADEK